MRTKQLSLLKGPRNNTKLWWIVKRSTYGGSLNYRKVRRPFDSTKLTHAVFKADVGSTIWFTKFEGDIRILLTRAAARYGIRVKDLAVNRDHIHLLFYTKSKEAYTCFLRFFSAEMGRRYARVRRRLNLKPRALWVARPFTRLVSWGKKSLNVVRRYIRRNREEAMGFVAYKPRDHALAKFLVVWAAQGFSSA